MPKRVKRIRHMVQSPSKFQRLTMQKPDVLHGYLHHAEINQYMEYIATRYSSFVRLHTVGRSYEKRPLKALEIDWCAPQNLQSMPREARVIHKRFPWVPQYTPNEYMATPLVINGELKTMTNRLRNIVFIEGGTHAREWITISVALNCIYQLTEKHLRNREILRGLRFFIVPIVNPDGYEFTRLKNRNWRKNRRPQKGHKFVGTDCNRNYDFHWENGSSKANRCTYKGDKPFSEPETCALRNVLLKLAPQLLFVLSLHSYAQSIMYPWGYSKELPKHWPKLHLIASVGRQTIREYNGRQYRVGSIAQLSKRTISGSIVDYAYGIIKVPIALVMELPAVEFGFHPPLEAISPIGCESWHGIRAMCKLAFDLHRDIIVIETPKSHKRSLKTIKTKENPAEEDHQENLETLQPVQSENQTLEEKEEQENLEKPENLEMPIKETEEKLELSKPEKHTSSVSP